MKMFRVLESMIVRLFESDSMFDNVLAVLIFVPCLVSFFGALFFLTVWSIELLSLLPWPTFVEVNE